MKQPYNYAELIKSFLNKEIQVHAFEKIFLDEFKKEKAPISEDLFQILDDLFYYVDAFTDFPLAPELSPDDYINEDQLRDRAAKTLAEIQKLQRNGRMTE